MATQLIDGWPRTGTRAATTTPTPRSCASGSRPRRRARRSSTSEDSDPTSGKVLDLMAALEASVEAAKERRSAAEGAGAQGDPEDQEDRVVATRHEVATDEGTATKRPRTPVCDPTGRSATSRSRPSRPERRRPRRGRASVRRAAPPRPRGCTTTCGSKPDGVLVSWAVPKGPTLDPDVEAAGGARRGPSARLLRLRRRDPRRRVRRRRRDRVGLGHVDARPTATIRAQAIEAGDLHFDLHGEKLRGRFRAACAGARGRQEQWLLLHKHDERAVPVGTPRTIPQSVKSGRTNDEVKAAPAASWSSHGDLGRPRRPTNWPPSTRSATGARGSSASTQLQLTNLDKVLFPALAGDGASTKRDSIRHHASDRPGDAPVPRRAARATSTASRTASTSPASGTRRAPSHAPEWIDDAGATTRPTPARPSATSCSTPPPALAWVANYGAIEVHPWTSTVATSPPADVGDDRHRSREREHVRRRRRAGPAAPDRARAPRRPGGSEGDRPARTSRSGSRSRTATRSTTRARGSRRCRGAIGQTVPELVSWEWEVSKRGGRARLDYTQNAINKTLVAPFSARPAPGAPVSVPIAWDELDDPDLRPDAMDDRQCG